MENKISTTSLGQSSETLLKVSYLTDEIFYAQSSNKEHLGRHRNGGSYFFSR